MTPEHLTGPTQVTADAIAERLDLERFERNGWPTVARDLADTATPAVLRWAYTYLHAVAAQETDDAVGVGYARAADHLSNVADLIGPPRVS